MKPYLKRITALCCALSISAAALSGCGCNKEPEPVPVETTAPVETTVPPTTVPVTTAPATVDSALKKTEYDLVAIKQNSEKISSDFNEIIKDSNFNGSVYMKLGNDFEFISTTGASDSVNHVDNSVNTRFCAGEITNQITAAAVMLLVEDGKLNLYDKVDEFYPQLAYADFMTIEHLLNHTAGVKNYVDHIGTSNRIYFLRSELENSVSKDNSAEENKEIILDWILSSQAQFLPGTEYDYSASDYFLLGEIIEEVSGESYEDFVYENILKPLGMRNTDFETDSKIAVAYGGRESGERMTYPGVGGAAFGMVSTVTDLLKWTDAITSDALLSEKSRELMFTPRKQRDGSYSGMGVSLGKGLISVSSECGAYKSSLIYSEDRKQIFISLTNQFSSNPVSLYEEFNNYLSKYESLFPAN